MAKTRVASVGRAPKSKLKIIYDNAVRRHAEDPEGIEEIERRTWEFQKRVQRGEVLDLPAALEQFEREIERIGTHSPSPPKARPKTPPGPKTVSRRIGGHKPTSWAKKRQTGAKRQTRKKRIGGK